MIRKIVPRQARLKAKLILRFLSDLRSGMIFQFASIKGEVSETITFQIEQSLGDNENKIENLRIASRQIHQYLINPGEVFSFWRAVGNPIMSRGFKKSRSIVAQGMTETVGGGLCQLSGILYFLSLQVGLQIIERHNHTMDIYSEEERYAPLGADATVVYGYKDLRIRNNLKVPIKFSVRIQDKRIVACVLSENNLGGRKITFEREVGENGMIEVRTMSNGKEIGRSRYKQKCV